MNKRFAWCTAGKADAGNIVCGKAYRFTVLTDRMIRMEYDACGVFEDRATQIVFYRDFPKNDFTITRKDGVLKIETASLILTYNENEMFAADTLSIYFKDFRALVWHYGDRSRQLKGTARTLDKANGAIPLEDGVCSREGYTTFEDSDSMVLSEDGWFDLRREGQTDTYFLGYGHDYLGCIKDFYKLTGVPPMLPDYALGNWWSRYHDYSQQEYCDLIERFEREDIPFSVSVVDMDWHYTTAPEEARIDDRRWNPGWTGYSWNPELFPDYKEFLRFLKRHNLKTSLNLHPAEGVGCHEDMYEQMARACGIDPESKKLVKFDCLNPDFMANYFDILHHPYEEQGVDFWWMDWQQGTDYWWVHDEDHPKSKLEKMDPLWLLNHLHIMDISRNGKRPMFFSRYSGFGSHRYPVGFSGDTYINWESLDFQPYFTANASNVGYSWWSHDIGGHMGGFRDDELQIRWLQLGVFSPINRLHSSNSGFSGKEPWNLNKECRSIAEDWLRLRHRMFPYIYTMNYRNHTKLEPLVQPMYYAYPEMDEAYEMKNQFFFGSELMVAPITQKNDAVSLHGHTKVWFPEGEWYDMFTGLRYRGESIRNIHRPLEQMPVFAKSGAIIPMEKYGHNNTLGRKVNMEAYIFPGADNVFTLYEDEGDGSEYQNGRFATTDIAMEWGKEVKLTVHAAKGDTSVLPEKRQWTLYLRGWSADIQIAVQNVAAECGYDKLTATWTIVLPETAIDQDIVLNITCDGCKKTNNATAYERAYDIMVHAQTGYAWKDKTWAQFFKKNRPKEFDQSCDATCNAVLEMIELYEGK